MSKNYKEVPGNSVASAALIDTEMKKKGIALTRVSNHMETGMWEEVAVTSVRFRAPQSETGDWMCVVSAWTALGQSVAFVTAPTYEGVVVLFAQKYINRQLKWKEDAYAK